MRVKYGKARRKSKKRIFREAKGRRGGRRNLLRTVKVTNVGSRAFAFRVRRVRKREFRRLWMTRVNAACRELGISYSQFIFGLKKADIELNRKTLSELAIHEPDVFAEVVAAAKEALGN